MKKDNSNGNKFEDAHAYGGSCCGDVCSVADPEMINAKADRDLVDAVVEATVERRQNAPAKIETGKDDTENILLFKTSTCPNCRAAEAVLRKSGVDYVEIYADDDKNRSLVDGFEIMQAPTLVVQSGENGENVMKYLGVSAIVGWLKTR